MMSIMSWIGALLIAGTCVRSARASAGSCIVVAADQHQQQYTCGRRSAEVSLADEAIVAEQIFLSLLQADARVLSAAARSSLELSPSESAIVVAADQAVDSDEQQKKHARRHGRARTLTRNIALSIDEGKDDSTLAAVLERASANRDRAGSMRLREPTVTSKVAKGFTEPELVESEPGNLTASDKETILPIEPPPRVAAWSKTVSFHLSALTMKQLQHISSVIVSVTESTSTPMMLTGGDRRAKMDQEAASSMLMKVANNQTVSVHEIQDLVELFSKSQTADAAAKNSGLVTASDIASLMAGFRGEDYGANYNYAPDPEGNINRATYQGDILQDSENRPWRNARVKYCYAKDTTPRVKHVFKAAISHYTKALPCISFENVGWESGLSTSGRDSQKCMESPAVFVTSNPDFGCFTHRGMMDGLGSQQLQLNDPGCTMLGTAIHELGHVLGLGHEHPAASTSILHASVKHGRGKSFEFDSRPGLKASHNSLSIMHLDPFAFSDDPRRPTLRGPDFSLMGQRVGLASSDVDQLQSLYSLEGCLDNGLAGLGCVNNPDGHGDGPVCPAFDAHTPWCSSGAFKKCCACGGGTTLQCYKGTKCPQAMGVFYFSQSRLFLLVFLLVVLMSSSLGAGYVMMKPASEKVHVPYALDLTTDGLKVVDLSYDDDGSEQGEARSQTGSEDLEQVYGALSSNAPRQNPHIEHTERDSGTSSTPPPSTHQVPEVAGSANSFQKIKHLAYGVVGWQSAALREKERRNPSVTKGKLGKDAYEQFQGAYAPLGAGLSSGRGPVLNKSKERD